MKKIFAILMLLPALAVAGGSTPRSGSDSGSIASFDEFPRVLMYGAERVVNTPDGELLICEYPAEVSWRVRSCLIEKQNAWKRINHIRISGHDLSHYEIRFTGSSGHTTVILYFKKQ